MALTFDRDTNMDAELENAGQLYDAKRFHEAYQAYLKLAKNGSISSQAFVGWLSWKGIGTEKNIDEAIKWLEAAANAGDAEAQFYLGRLYEIDKKLPHLSVPLYKRAADQGDLPAMYRLGRMYQNGKGVVADKRRAIECYEKAASAGHVFAKREFAMCLIKGYQGPLRIPAGLLLFVTTVMYAIRLAWNGNIDDERAVA